MILNANDQHVSAEKILNFCGADGGNFIILTPTIRAAPHRYDITRIRHLIVDFSNRWSHFVRHSSGD
jgi:hypothetical protein